MCVFCFAMGRGAPIGYSDSGFHRSCPSELVFPPPFLKIVVDVKAPPHV